VVKAGILRATKQTDAPAAYELMTEPMNRLEHRLCYVDPAQANLSRYEGKHVRISGNQRWRKDDRYAVLSIERVDMVW
jgi:hypothetical protein